MGNNQNTRSDSAKPSCDPLGSPQHIRPDLLGFIFHLSWLFLLFYSDALSTGSPTPGGGSTTAVYVASMLALTAVLLFGYLRTRTFMKLGESRIGTVGAPVVTAAGTLLYCMLPAVPSLALVGAAGVLTGAGSAVMAARWASVFGNASPRTIIANFPTILVAITAICVSIDYLPLPLCLALLVVLPLCSGAALQFARRYQHERRDADVTRAPKPERPRKSRYGVLAAFVALIGFTAAVPASLEVDTVNYGMIFYLVSAVLMLGFVGVSIFLTDRPSFVPLLVAPSVVLLVVLLPFIQYSVEIPGDAFYPVGNISIELMLLFGTVLFALMSDQSPARMFMMGRMAMALSDLAGSALGEHLAPMGDTTLVVQLASVLLFFSVELVLAALVASSLANRWGQLRAEGGMTGRADEGAPAFARAVGPEPALTADEPAVPSHVERLTEVADRFDLSERERDVLALLAEGRSSARIQKDLCISAGTVNYHTRNIYAKMGVHSRQEIIDLIHNARLA